MNETKWKMKWMGKNYYYLLVNRERELKETFFFYLWSFIVAVGCFVFCCFDNRVELDDIPIWIPEKNVCYQQPGIIKIRIQIFWSLKWTENWKQNKFCFQLFFGILCSQMKWNSILAKKKFFTFLMNWILMFCKRI